MNMDILFNIIFYGIIALVPLLIILIVFFNNTKLVRAMAKSANQPVNYENNNSRYTPHDYESINGYPNVTGVETIDNPAFSNVPGNLYYNHSKDRY